MNERPRVSRREYDALRAQLHNAAATGLGARPPRAHRDPRARLEGRIAWVASLDPERGRRLRALLEGVPRAVTPRRR